MNTNNKETVRLLIEEAINQGNLSVLKEIIHPDYAYASPTESMNGIDQLEAFILALRSAFPDLAVRIEEQFGENEKVCTRISMTGIHKGDFLGLPATGKTVNLEGVIISQLQDGLIKKEWELLDQLTLLQQLGLASK
ncbi:MAG: ester cyclase [Verrucomicrobiota bacterium]